MVTEIPMAFFKRYNYMQNIYKLFLSFNRNTNKDYIKFMKGSIFLLLLLFLFNVSLTLFAQVNSDDTTMSDDKKDMMSEEKNMSDKIKGVVVEFFDTNDENMFNIKAELTEGSAGWQLSISEFTGRVIFSDEGSDWKEEGYDWTPDKDIALYSGIYYTVTISFLDTSEKIMKSVSSKFYMPLKMENNRAPILFFEGDTVTINTNLYQNASYQQVIDFIIDRANRVYPDYRILIRGHASYLTVDSEDRQKEQIALLDLSKRRAERVLDILIENDLDITRLYYEALGGSDEIGESAEERWKNRRVEIYFIRNINKISDNNNEKIQAKPKITPSSGKIAPWHDIPVLGVGQMTPDILLQFILYYTPTNDPKYIDYLKRIILFYMNESTREVVNHDVALAQMLLETNYLRFTGQVRREQYNFAGIGAVNDRNVGNWFATERLGVRAHIQHLKGYATSQPLRGELVDPRYPVLDRLGLLGSAPLVSSLSGRWATDPDYSKKILIIIRRMYDYSNALNNIE